MRHPVPLLSQRRQKVSTVHWAESSLPAARTVESLQETALGFRDMAGEELRLLFSFIPSLPASEGSERVTFGRGKIFPQVSRRGWLIPSCVPIFHRNERTRPSAPHRSTLDDWATNNRFCAMYFVPACTFGIRTNEFQFFWVIEVGPQRNSGSCDT